MKISAATLTVAGSFVISKAVACPFPPEDQLLLAMRAVVDSAIVRIETLGASTECTGIGSGFFISAAGHVATAEHVVPRSCSNQSIMLRWSDPNNSATLTHGVSAKVVGRTRLDVAILEPQVEVDRRLDYVRLEIDPQRPAMEFKNECVLLASHYVEQTDTLTSFAEISSISLVGDPRRWALAGDGFNPSRSGSPIILATGRAVAVFVARPGDPADRTQIIQGRALIVPLRSIEPAEIDFAEIAMTPGKLSPFPEFLADGPMPIIKELGPVTTSFGLSMEVAGFRLDPNLPTYVLRSDSLLPMASLESGVADALLKGGSVLREIAIQRTFDADRGYAFDPDTFALDVASHNPPVAPLPNERCQDDATIDCYQLSDNNTRLTLRLRLFPGVDGRRSWLDGEVRIVQRPT